MLGQWALALAADHYNGAYFNTPGFLSWNTRDIFQGMSQYVEGFPSTYPLVLSQYSGAPISVTGTVAKGSAAFYDLIFPTKQSIGIQATATTDLPATTGLRLSIVRMQ